MFSVKLVGNTLEVLRREQRPAEGADRGAEAERHDLQLVDRDRHRRRRQRVIAQRAPRPAGSRGVEQVQEPGQADDDDQRDQ